MSTDHPDASYPGEGDRPATAFSEQRDPGAALHPMLRDGGPVVPDVTVAELERVLAELKRGTATPTADCVPTARGVAAVVYPQLEEGARQF